ncbi:TetR/AcrR family transcriptional regulator [Glycomyces buryatensis]|uniref:TetR/AcrR family transcriptional regulator n=1 Tax=Glycomyces buryatensis TaxID=2570927 RepID=A0A4S8Q843_9ACTN|nr:TetR/AcrR family transcriptional regulator [Glycomyces buryatensis]THV40543.1 TetR/AcrR family transcriptional regulator [Glycomyces buryatensis]
MGQDAYRMLWGPGERPTRGRPATLSRGRIVAEAVAIADAEGLEKVSMKRIAEQLGSGVMSLYRHVPGKDELIALMIDTAIGTPPQLPIEDGWRTALAEWARATRDFFVAHRWALPLATLSRVIGPNETLWLDRGLSALAGEPLSGEERMFTVMAVNGYVRGAVQPELNGADDSPEWFRFAADPAGRERFPNATALLADGSLSARTPQRYFEFGLERVLDGLERYIEEQRKPDA